MLKKVKTIFRISIDKEGGVDLNDCTIASEKLVKLWMKMIQYLKCIILMLHRQGRKTNKKEKIL